MRAQPLFQYILDLAMTALWRLGATLCLCLLAPAVVHAQGGSVYGQVISPQGYPVAFASVRICPTTSTGTPCTPLAASLWADPQMTVPVANPYTTDAFGNFSVFVPPATYYIVQVSFTASQQLYVYPYIVAAASNAVATAAPQYTIPVYTAPGTATTLGEGFVDLTHGQLRTDAAGGLYVPGPATFFGTLLGTLITGSTINTTGQYQVNGSQIAAANLADGLNGTGPIVLTTSPALVTPNIGVAAGISLNTSADVIAGGQVAATGNVSGAVVNAAAGYQLGGAAPLNHVLLGNGTSYVDSATIPSGALPSVFYQTVDANNVAQTQRPVLNFAPRLTVTDSASPAETTVDLAGTVTAGSCTACNVTYDAFGRITATSSGTGFKVVATSGIFNTCVMVGHSSTDISCSGTQSWSNSISGSYFTFCSLYQAGFNGNTTPDTNGTTRFVLGVSAMTTTTFTYWTSSLQGGASGANTQAYCQAVQ